MIINIFQYLPSPFTRQPSPFTLHPSPFTLHPLPPLHVFAKLYSSLFSFKTLFPLFSLIATFTVAIIHPPPHHAFPITGGHPTQPFPFHLPPQHPSPIVFIRTLSRETKFTIIILFVKLFIIYYQPVKTLLIN